MENQNDQKMECEMATLAAYRDCKQIRDLIPESGESNKRTGIQRSRVYMGCLGPYKLANELCNLLMNRYIVGIDELLAGTEYVQGPSNSRGPNVPSSRYAP